MPGTRREPNTSKAIAAPIFGIVVLVGVYWLISDWDSLPKLITATLAAIN